MNTAVVLRAVRQCWPSSRPEISRTTGLSRPTVNDIAESWLRAGHLCESLPDANADARVPGPEPGLVGCSTDLGYVLGLGTGANRLLAPGADLEGCPVVSEMPRVVGPGTLRPCRRWPRIASAQPTQVLSRLCARGLSPSLIKFRRPLRRLLS